MIIAKNASKSKQKIDNGVIVGNKGSAQMIQPFLGFNENGELKIYINPWGKLNTLSPMHSRGKEFPPIVYDITSNNAVDALQAACKYFNEAQRGAVRRRAAGNEHKIRAGQPKSKVIKKLGSK